MMNSSLMESINIKAEKVADHASLSESLLANEQGGDIQIEERIVFLDEQYTPPVGGNEEGGGDMADVVVHTAGERPPSHWRDAWAAAIFLAHQAAIFYLAFTWGIPSLNYEYTEGTGNTTTNGEGEVHFGGFLLLCFLSSTAAVLVGTAAISIMIKFAEKTIQFSLLFAVICNVAVTLSLAMDGQWIGAGISAFFLVWLVLYARAVWHRVPFAAANLLAALTAVQTNGGIILVAIGAAITASLWTLVWILASVGVYMRKAECHEGTCETHTNGFFFVLLLLSYYWTSEVFKNAMHVTTAGTVGTWWFAPDDACTYCSAAIADSLRRATTYSLGSVCFGSLVTALLQLLHGLCHEVRRRGRGNETLLMVVECLLAILESLVRYFNKWAYIYIGLYGYSYLDSGTKVVTLFRQRGWTAIISDDLVSRALSLVSLLIGALTGCIGLALASASNWMVADTGGSSLVLAFFVPFLCGLALSFVLLSVVSSAVNTVIVCFAEAPLEFERNHPGLNTQMTRAYALAYPDEFRQ